MNRYLEEGDFWWTCNKSDKKFDRKPHYTDGFNDKERFGIRGHFVLHNPGQIGRYVEYFVMFKLGQRLQTKDENGKDDDHHGDDCNHTGPLWALRILKQ